MAVVDLQPLAARDLQLARLQAQLFQNRRVNVGDVVTIFDSVESDFVGGSVDDTSLQTAAGHPNRETENVVISPVGSLGPRRASELGRKDDERFIKKSSLI